MQEKISRYINKVDRLFIATVIVPTIVAILYFGFFASDVYISESRFIVRSPEKPAVSGLGAMLKTAGFTNAGTEVFAVKDYITSRDALAALDKKDAVEKAYGNGEISFFDRFDPMGTDRTKENLLRYFLKKVSVKQDTTSSITTLIVRAYTPADAHRFNSQLLQQAEGVVNEINDRGRNDLIAYATTEVREAQDDAARSASALARYRNRKGVIDPEKQATVQIEMVSKLQDELIAARNQLSQLQSTVPDNSQIGPLRVRIADLQQEIKNQMASVAGSSGSLSATAVEFQRLSLENQFADKQLAAAMNALLDARNEARRKQAYVERIVEPNVPDAAVEPRRLRGVIATMILGLIAWGVLGMLIAGVKEHRE